VADVGAVVELLREVAASRGWPPEVHPAATMTPASARPTVVARPMVSP
jgi:hypothetical protein